MLHHRTKLILLIGVLFLHHRRLVCAFMRMHAYAHPKVVSERKKRARYTEEKRSTSRLSAKCLVTTKCARAPLGRNQSSSKCKLYTSLPRKRLTIPFCIIARAIRRNEKQKSVQRYKTKPLFFSLGTCRLSDSCSARVTLARVSSSCARDGEIS